MFKVWFISQWIWLVLDTITTFLKNFKDIKFDIEKHPDYSKIKSDIDECEKEFQEDLKNGTLKTL